MTFGVVMLSILVHGLTMAPLLRRLGIVRSDDEQASYNLLRGELQTAAAAVEEIERLERLRSLAPDAIAQLKADYQARMKRTRAAIGELTVEQGRLRALDIQQARHHLLLVEKTAS